MSTHSTGAASRPRAAASSLAAPSPDVSLRTLLARHAGVTEADALPAVHVLEACDRVAMVASHRGDILWMNPAASTRLGVDRRVPAGGVSLRSLVTDLEAAEDAFARSLHTSIEDVPLTLRGADGATVTLLWSLAPLLDTDGRATALAMIGSEPSRFRTVRLLDALHALGESDDLVASSSDPTMLYSRIADVTLRAVDAPVAWIVVREEADDVTVTVDSIAPGDPRRRAVRTPRLPDTAVSSPMVGEAVLASTLSFDPRLPDPLRLWATEQALTRLIAVPLRTGLGQIGTLGVAVRGDAALGDDEEGRLRQFADAAAALVERARLLRQDADHARRVAALADAIRAMRSAASHAEMTQALLRAAPSITGCSRAVLFVAPAADADFRLAGSISPAAPAPASGLTLARADIPMLLEHAERSRSAAMIDDALTSPYLPGPIVQLLGLRSGLVAPIISSQGITGLLLADEPHAVRTIPPRAVGLVTALMHHAASAYELLDARERSDSLARALDARTTELETIQRVNTATHRTLELDQVLRNAAEEGRRIANVHRVAILLAEDGDSATLRAVAGEVTSDDALGRMFPLATFTRTRLALHTQRVVEITDMRTDALGEDERAWMERVGIRSALIVPIVGHNRAIGTVSFSSVGDVKAFTDREKELCQMLAQNLAIAIENARMYEAERRQHHYAETISRISRTVSTTLSVNRVLRAVGEEVVRILGADRCGIFLLEDEQEGVLRAEYFHGLSETMTREAFQRRMTLSQPILKQLFTDGVPIRIADPRTDPRTTKEIIAQFSLGPMILMPLVVRDTVIGVVGVDRADGFRDVSDQDIALAMAICDHAAVAAQNARIYAETEARVRDMEALYDISNRLGSAQKQEDIVDYVLLQVRDLLPCQQVQLFLIDDDTGQLMLTTSRSALGQEGAPPDGHPTVLSDLRGCWALNQGQPFVVSDIERHFRCREDASGEGVPARSYACIPILAGGKPFGVLRIVAAEPRGLTREHLRLINAITGQLGVAVQRMRLMRQLEERTVRDPLTDVSNHRHFLEKLRAELTRSLRSKLPVAVLYVDVDNFKEHNDRFGHQIGDGVLRTVAQVLGECVRASDEVGRVGGDEFALFLPNTDADGASIVAEKLRERLAETRFPGDFHQPVVRATVSIGLATFPSHGTTAEEVMRAADRALYRSKAAGRDRVMVAGGE